MSNLNIQATFAEPFALSMYYIEDCTIYLILASISPAYDIVLIMEMVKADGSPRTVGLAISHTQKYSSDTTQHYRLFPLHKLFLSQPRSLHEAKCHDIDKL